MTRMEKWETYRQEINQSSYIGYSIVSQTKQIEKYKQAIDKINPSILQNVGDKSPIVHKGISEVDVSHKQIPEQFVKMFKDLDKTKYLDNHNNISTILFNIKNESIIDQNKKVKEDWLRKNSDYVALNNFINQAKLSLNKDNELEKDLLSKYENLSNNKQQTHVGTINKLTENINKSAGHYVFIISVSIACLFFLFTIILLLIRWFVY